MGLVFVLQFFSPIYIPFEHLIFPYPRSFWYLKAPQTVSYIEYENRDPLTSIFVARSVLWLVKIKEEMSGARLQVIVFKAKVIKNVHVVKRMRISI